MFIGSNRLIETTMFEKILRVTFNAKYTVHGIKRRYIKQNVICSHGM